jgi:bifunctional non-homologous end joining protein LigD
MKVPAAANATVAVGSKSVALTNLSKVFFPEIGATKRDLLQYYADVAPYLLPHIRDRAMVMKRYPNGAAADFFFMKRTPSPHPEWLETCRIEHSSGNVIDFPMINDLAALLWVINLGCIDLNQWYATCDDIDRPDYVHFDLDPGNAPFEQVIECALLVRDGLAGLGMKSYPKTSGSKGIHVYVPIKRGPLQKEVWTFAKSFAVAIAKHEPDLMTSEYRKEKRPPKRVLVDYNQNRWGSTLASVYSIRPTPRATVSAPLTWEEVERGVAIEDFRIDNMMQRIKDAGDLWAPLAKRNGRFDLSKVMGPD